MQKQEAISYDTLILANGSQSDRADWPGEELKGVQSMINIQDIEMMEQNTQHVSQAVIVGGGLIGVEMAECLHSRHIPVTILIREEAYWQNVLPLAANTVRNGKAHTRSAQLTGISNIKLIQGSPLLFTK